MFCSNAMATDTALWQLLMMAALCFSYKGLSVSGFSPNCHIPCGDSGCSGDIICTWDPVPGPNNTLTYTLHWDGFQSKAKDHRAIIRRNQYTSHSELQVWVQTKHQNGTVSISEPATFNTVNIIKPPPPKIISSSREPMQIHWTSHCDKLTSETGHCEVRHRTEAQPEWIQPEEGGVSGSYTLKSPDPCTNYSFQIRCACETSLMSEWSKIYMKRSAEKAPIGTLDVWRDCGILPQSTQCVLTWKKLPMSKACVLGYNLRLHFNNGTLVALNKSVTSSVLMCGKVQCYFNISLKNVKSVSIEAYNAHGYTPLSHLDIQVPVEIPEKEAINLEMTKNSLIVYWKNIPWIPDLKEYLVQYKEAGSSLGQGLDWIRVNPSFGNATIKGQFKNFTAYQVSVFKLLDHNKIQLYCTDVTHFVQGKPAKVPSFDVLSYNMTHATLQWSTVLMSVQNGVIPYYQIGYGKDNVQNRSAYPQLKKRNVSLDNLKEDNIYKVWIRAVNQAGPGPIRTVQFTTRANEKTGVIKILPGVLGGLVLIPILILALFCCREKKACPTAISSLYEKVPDPHNSKIIKEMKFQINDSLNWLSVPAQEQCPKISEIEIVKTSSCSFIPQTHITINSEDSDNSQEDLLRKSHHDCRKQEYSKMVDSDEERNEDVTSKNSWTSEEDNAGYEQHFMPTATDIQEIEEQERQEKRCSE